MDQKPTLRQQNIRTLLRIVLGLLAAGLALLSVLIVVSHNLALQSAHLLTALSFVQPGLVFIFALPAAFGFFLLSYRKISVVLLCLVGLNALWNEDYKIMPNFVPRTGQAEDPRVQILAWNVQGFFFGIPRVSETIRDSGADVLLLSEVSLKPHELGVFQKAIWPYRALLSEQGDVAIVTRLPILEAKEVPLPTHQASLTKHNQIQDQIQNPPRSFLHARVQVGTRALHVLSLRFIAGRAKSEGLWDSLRWGLYLWDQQEREVQFFSDYVRRLKGPYVFGGDLNAPPASRTMRQVETLGQDTYMRMHRWGHYTFMTKILPSSREKDLPVMRLDYIFSSPDLLVEAAERLKLRVSDHYPIRTRLVFPASKPIPVAGSLLSEERTSL